MPNIIIAESSEGYARIIEEILSDIGLTAGSDFVSADSFADAVRRLSTSDAADDGSQLIIFGTSPAEITCVDQIIKSARAKNSTVSILGLFGGCASADVDRHILAPHGLSGGQPERTELRDVVRFFLRSGMLVRGT